MEQLTIWQTLPKDMQADLIGAVICLIGAAVAGITAIYQKRKERGDTNGTSSKG